MKKIKNIIFRLATTTILLTSCNNNPVSNDKENALDVFTKIYSVDNLNAQTFTIDNSIDNLITGESGTIIRINRNTFVDQDGKAITGKVKLNEDGTAPKTVSTSQMSYDMRLDNYDKLLKLVASISNYNPNEQDMKIADLQAQAQILRTLNQNVITANNVVSNARISRNKAFYTDTNNASEIVTKIKNYIRYVFGTQSPEYKQIISINFRKVRI